MLQKYWLNVLAVALNVNRILLCTALKLNSCDQGRSQDFSKGGAEAMEAKALKRKNCL